MVREIHLEEFLWRGGPTGGDPATSWHTRLIATGGTDDFGKPIPAALSDPMSPEQSAAMGFPLPKVIETINTAALAEVEGLRASKAGLEKALATEQERGADLERALEAERAASAERIEALRAQVARMKTAPAAAADA